MYLNSFDRLHVLEFKKNKEMRCICTVVDIHAEVDFPSGDVSNGCMIFEPLCVFQPTVIWTVRKGIR